MNSDDIILNYNDAVLRRSDLAILQSPSYLNDRLIDFYFAHLSTAAAVASASGDVSGHMRRPLLVPSSLSFWLANCPDAESRRTAAAALDLAAHDLVLFTVNDNQDLAAAEAGAHWSLLVYCRAADRFVHHDSLAGLNRPHADALRTSVLGFFGAGAAPLFEGPTPQQGNGYDCGVYVMAIARVVCDWWAGGGGEEGWFGALEKAVDAEAIRKLRGEVLRIILGLMEKRA